MIKVHTNMFFFFLQEKQQDERYSILYLFRFIDFLLLFFFLFLISLSYYILFPSSIYHSFIVRVKNNQLTT